MTVADKIRQMDDEGLVQLLVWGTEPWGVWEVPTCDEGCEDYACGCAEKCPHEKQERAVREWLKKEVD